MTQMLDKQKARFEREHTKLSYIKVDLELALSNFRAWKHKLWLEYEEKGGGIGDTVESDDYSGRANYYYKFHKQFSHGIRRIPSLKGDIVEPLDPAKIRPDTKLVFKEREKNFKDVVRAFKKSGKLRKIPLILTPEGYIYASAASVAMKKKMLVLKLIFGADGYLYSPMTFNYDWNWQSQAIWLRSIGMGDQAISKRLKMSVNTVKAMFGRLKILKYFKPYSLIDWATTGYGRYVGETPSGWRAVLVGGSSGILHPSDKGFEAKFTIGEMTGAHREGLLEVEHFSIERVMPENRLFNFEKHQKGVIKRNKEEIKRRKQMTLEQKTIEIETLQKNIEKGFDPETGKYKEDKNG